MQGRTVGIFGLSGTGKTSQAGEYAKWIKKTTGKNSEYYGADYGGNDVLLPHIDAGFVIPHILTASDNPWVWLNNAVTTPPGKDIGLRIFDSGTSAAEAMLADCAKAAAVGIQIGQEKIYKQSIPTGVPNKPLVIGANNKSQYGLVQTYVLDMIRRSTWLANDHGIDVLWTFGEQSGEDPNDDPVVGPKLIGKALTGTLPKELRYLLRLDVRVSPGGEASHLLYTQQQPDRKGLGYSFGNARYPLDATVKLPPVIEPASLITFWELVAQARKEAAANLLAEVSQ